MRVSVALAARNSERYLGELLESVGRQTVPPSELVACDDASEDSTLQLLHEFAMVAPFPVRIERFPSRCGHVAAFMDAARRCQGEAIAFCDQDDVWSEDKLEVCGRELERSGANLVLHAARVVDAELRDLGATWPPIEETRLVPALGLTGLEMHEPGMAMVFRSGILSVADFETRPPSRYGLGRQMLHDEWVAFLAGVIGPIKLVAEPLALYRQHDDNESGGWFGGTRELSLRPAVGNYLQAAEHTVACAEYLEAAHSEDDAIRERLVEGARAYRRASENWSLRATLYDSRDRRRRARLLRRLVSGRAYRARDAGGFGRTALAKDIVSGVAMRMAGGADD